MEQEIELQLKAILREVRTRPLGELLRAHDDLANDVGLRGGRAALAEVLSSRLTLLVLFRRPIEECTPTADTLLELAADAGDTTLSTIGTFATHCEDMGDRVTGATYLEAALDRAIPAGAKSSLITVQQRLLSELRK